MTREEIDTLIEEEKNKKEDEIYFRSLTNLLIKGEFSAAELIFDDFIETIQIDNFFSKIEIIIRAIEEGRNKREEEFENLDNAEILINLSKSINAFNEDFTFDDDKNKDPNTEKETTLIYHITQTLYYALQLDNIYEMSKMNKTNIEKINLLLDNFIGKYTDNDPYNKRIDWRKINVKTLQ